MAVASAWAKPGSWALDAEANDSPANLSSPAASADFPTLAAAAAASKPLRRKKPQTLSLAEFTASKSSSSPSKAFTPDELLALPTGPRERSADELDRSSRGFGYSSYGAGGRGRIEDSDPRWGGSRASDEPRGAGSVNRESGPSRADEVDDWGAAKKPIAPVRRERFGGLIESQFRADESESWMSNKVTAPASETRRTDCWGFDPAKDRRGSFETLTKDGGLEADACGKKREEPSGGRPRLVLQPRSLPLANGSNNGEQPQGLGSGEKSKGSNPFGAARPREEVLAEKGKDWRKIDEKLETMKMHEASAEKASFTKKGSVMGNGNRNVPEDRTERTWRNTETNESPSACSEGVQENELEN